MIRAKVGQVWNCGAGCCRIEILEVDDVINSARVWKEGTTENWIGQEQFGKGRYSVLESDPPAAWPSTTIKSEDLMWPVDPAPLKKRIMGEFSYGSTAACECGSEKCGSSQHSTWCPKHTA